jgi:hypothetical protein
MTEHEQLLARVATLVERAHWLRRDAEEVGTPVGTEALASIVMGALVALEGGDIEIAENLLAGYLAQYTETRSDGYCGDAPPSA